MCYQRDGYRCAMCGAKGKVHAHHIVPVAISHDNSLANLITVCGKCHRKLESVGYKILKSGGHKTDVRRVEFQMIAEAKKKRKEEYESRRIAESSGENDNSDEQKNQES